MITFMNVRNCLVWIWDNVKLPCSCYQVNGDSFYIYSVALYKCVINRDVSLGPKLTIPDKYRSLVGALSCNSNPPKCSRPIKSAYIQNGSRSPNISLRCEKIFFWECLFYNLLENIFICLFIFQKTCTKKNYNDRYHFLCIGERHHLFVKKGLPAL